MKWVVRILAVLVLLVVVAGAAAFFLLPKSVQAQSSLVVARPSHSVVTWLATTPAGDAFAEGVTETVTSAAADRIEADLALGKGKAKANYALETTPEGVRITISASRDLGGDLLARMNAAGAQAALQSALDAGTQSLEAELNALPEFDFAGLAYTIEEAAPRPFIYLEASTKAEAANIKNAMRQSLPLVRTAMETNNLAVAGPPIAVEIDWVEGAKYEFQAGIPYSGQPPSELFGVKDGMTPSGRVIKVMYEGPEENIIPVYDQVESLIKASRLSRSGPSFEVFLDDPTQDGGSAKREIYHLIEGDSDALQKIPTT